MGYVKKQREIRNASKPSQKMKVKTMAASPAPSKVAEVATAPETVVTKVRKRIKRVADAVLPTATAVHNAKVELGDLVQDVVSGFKGVVITWGEHLHGCDRIVIDPTELKADGSPQAPYCFDVQRLTIVEKSKIKPQPVSDHSTKLTLGAKVRDTLTGFEGIVSARFHTLGGFSEIDIDPCKVVEGAVAKSHAFNAERVELIAEQPVPVAPEAPKNGKPGGPSDMIERKPARR